MKKLNSIFHLKRIVITMDEVDNTAVPNEVRGEIEPMNDNAAPDAAPDAAPSAPPSEAELFKLQHDLNCKNEKIALENMIRALLSVIESTNSKSVWNVIVDAFESDEELFISIMNFGLKFTPDITMKKDVYDLHVENIAEFIEMAVSAKMQAKLFTEFLNLKALPIQELTALPINILKVLPLDILLRPTPDQEGLTKRPSDAPMTNPVETYVRPLPFGKKISELIGATDAGLVVKSHPESKAKNMDGAYLRDFIDNVLTCRLTGYICANVGHVGSQNGEHVFHSEVAPLNQYVRSYGKVPFTNADAGEVIQRDNTSYEIIKVLTNAYPKLELFQFPFEYNAYEAGKVRTLVAAQ